MMLSGVGRAVRGGSPRWALVLALAGGLGPGAACVACCSPVRASACAADAGPGIMRRLGRLGGVAFAAGTATNLGRFCGRMVPTDSQGDPHPGSHVLRATGLAGGPDLPRCAQQGLSQTSNQF